MEHELITLAPNKFFAQLPSKHQLLRLNISIQREHKKPVCPDIFSIKWGFIVLGYIRSMSNMEANGICTQPPTCSCRLVLQQRHHRIDKSPTVSYTCNFSATRDSMRLTAGADGLAVRSGGIIHKKEEKTNQSFILKTREETIRFMQTGQYLSRGCQGASVFINKVLNCRFKDVPKICVE